MTNSDNAEVEIVRLREWLEGIRDMAERAMPHAIGQGHAALMSLRSAAMKALAGEEEASYRYRTSADDDGLCHNYDEIF